MANRIVTATVSGESIKLSEKSAGASGSFNAVSLAFTFDSAWDGTTKKVYFFDAYGENAVYVVLTADLLVAGKYIVPIPAEPLAYAGEMTITIKGTDFATDGTTAERIIMSASTTMKVLSAIAPASDVAPVEPTPTQAEQLQTQIDSILADIVAAAAAGPSATAAAASALAAQTAKTNAETAESNAELAESNAGTHETNASTYATNASNSALAASGSATTAVNAKTSAETAQTAAELAETHAKTSETNAGNSASAASTSAGNAATSETNANSAKTAAQTAQGLAETAEANAELAETNAVAAKNAAESAKGLAETANTAAQGAKTAAETAQGLAEASATAADTSADLAEAARAAAVIAKNSANADASTATIKAGEAWTSATNANNAKIAAQTAQTESELAETNAQTAETNANAKAVLSESYAKGGTGSRSGEDTDNAKYYKDLAAEIVGGDYPTKTEAQGYVDTHDASGTAHSTLFGNKVDKIIGKGLSTEDYTSTEKTKLSGVEASANNYVHPTNHAPSIITQDASNRFVTDTEKSTWNGKLSTNGDGSSLTETFTQAATRANIATGETHSTIFGKIAKWFADFGAAAWMNTGSTSTTVALGNHGHRSNTLYMFADDVRTVVLTGLSTATNAAIAATDTVLSAFGKLQAQITGINTALDGKSASTHTHGNITNDGKIGSTADLPVFTTTAGAVTTKTAAEALTLLGAAKITFGSYTGTGTSGVDNPCSVAIGFTPKLIFIVSASQGTGYTRGSTATHAFNEFGVFVNPVTHYYATSGNTLYAGTISWADTMSWYNSDATSQLNSAYVTYDIVAIG